MKVTKQGIRKRCIVVNEIETQRFFLKKEGNYLVFYKKRKKGLEAIVEISLEYSQISPEVFWKIAEKETKGDNIYISKNELEKICNKFEAKEVKTKSDSIIVTLKQYSTLKNA